MRWWTDLVAVVKDIPRFVELKVARLTASLHEPFEVGPPDYAWCRTCKQPWPCKEFVSATEEIKRYRSKEQA
jgi:hypothetical protein